MFQNVLLEFREILLALSQQVKILRSALILEQSDVGDVYHQQNDKFLNVEWRSLI